MFLSVSMPRLTFFDRDAIDLQRDRQLLGRIGGRLELSGLALELVLRTIMEIRAHPILLAAMPVCTENSILVDCVTESPNVGAG